MKSCSVHAKQNINQSFRKGKKKIKRPERSGPDCWPCKLYLKIIITAPMATLFLKLYLKIRPESCLCLIKCCLTNTALHDKYYKIGILRKRNKKNQQISVRTSVSWICDWKEQYIYHCYWHFGISSNRKASCLCCPLVSTKIKSRFSFLNVSTPSTAIFTGSDSMLLLQQVIKVTIKNGRTYCSCMYKPHMIKNHDRLEKHYKNN